MSCKEGTREMTVRSITTTLVADWPGLAWLATTRAGEPSVQVLHGPGVEVADEWVCEAVWDGEFGSGDFDRTDVVAGSGVRLRGGRVIFVSSGSTVDRLLAASRLGTLWVSNSLPCLLEATRAAPDPAYPRYYWDFRSIVCGLRRYKRTLGTSGGPIEIVYFDNLSWDGWNLTVTQKPATAVPFSDFAAYRNYLASSMRAVAANLRDTRRDQPFAMLGTTSTGYDSPTVTVLAAEAGCDQVLSFDRARGGAADSGEAIAERVGVRTISVPRDRWQARSLPEPAFIAANAYGEEVHYSGAEAYLRRRVLFTGYHGDKVWAKQTNDLDGQIVRGDPSGLALAEFRLRAGFIHCPVAFWGARRVREIVALANTAEMAPWDLPGDYSRPICRRIVEEAGVDRESFGQSKLAASVVLHNEPRFMTDESMERYLGWLRNHRRAWLARGRLPPVPIQSLDRTIARANRIIGGPRLARLRKFPMYVQLEQRSAQRRLGPTYLRRFVFPWAVHEAKSAYRER